MYVYILFMISDGYWVQMYPQTSHQTLALNAELLWCAKRL